MKGKTLFGADRELNRFKVAARSAPAFSVNSTSASIISAIVWTVRVRC